jgi:hypothetical protein
MGLAFMAAAFGLAVSAWLLFRFLQQPAISLGSKTGSECWSIGCERGAFLTRRDSVVSTVSQCRALLRSDWRNEGYAGVGDRLTLLEARAGPNQRLVKTFGIENAFTTIDSDYHGKFVKSVSRQLRTAAQEWAAMSTLAMESVRLSLGRADLQTDGILLAPLVQMVVLKIVLSKFFPQDARLDNDAVIETVAECINFLWIGSKTANAAVNAGAKSEATASHKKSLRTALRKILPNHDAGIPRRNPLNIILPAYETLWRVVLRCLIETLWRQSSMSSLWIQCFRDFAENGYRFHSDPENDGSCAAADLVNETLRLYPPTKRVYRWQQMESPHGTMDADPELFSADIEALHRSPTEFISRNYPTNFMIGRWREFRVRGSAQSGAETPQSFIPFGYGPFVCPARGDFAPKAIIVLVGALYTVLRDAEVRLTADDELDRVPRQLPLETTRDSYMTLRLMSAESGGNDALVDMDDPEDRV